MAESGPPSGLTSTDEFGFLPFVVSSATDNQSESGFTVTPFGATLGLTDSDINGNASHNIFNGDFGLSVVDHDANGDILSVAGRAQVSATGVPEPLSMALFGSGVIGLLGVRGRGRRR